MTEELYVIAHGHTFCLDVNYVKKIIQLPELEMLPGAPADVVGMLNYGGKIIPVYDIAMLLGVGRVESYTLNTMIVVCSFENKEVGLIVDSIKSQNKITLDTFGGDGRIEGSNTYLESVVTLNDTIVMVPAMKKIILRQINLDDNV